MTGKSGASLALAVMISFQPALAQEGVDARLVDQAIDRGVVYLKTLLPPYLRGGWTDCDELILLTYLHAGVSTDDAVLRGILERMLKAPAVYTYKVSLQAMLLEKLDGAKYRTRIHECTQYLVDNQCSNGQWHYGETITAVPDAPAEAAPLGDKAGSRQTTVTRTLVKPHRTGPAYGDHSNSQYAALGLRACFDAGFAAPKESYERAAKGWRDAQIKKTRPGGTPYSAGGWCYCDGKHLELAGCEFSYASMTAGAVAALALHDHMAGMSWKTDPAVKQGILWLSQNFSVQRNTGVDGYANRQPTDALYYYLYGLERAAIVCGVEKLGRHDWYREGAKFLLAEQKKEGYWHQTGIHSHPALDTCFAILFLRRATRPIPTVDSFKPPREP